MIFGVGLLLVWAGFVEAFLSQYHEPVIPYMAKIAFGLVERREVGSLEEFADRNFVAPEQGALHGRMPIG